MPSKSYNGNSPLGGKRIDSRKGVDSAIGQLSKEVGRRTPKQSMSAGSLNVHNATFHVPKRTVSIASNLILPLTISRGTEASKFRIVSGTVNSQVPTLGGVALDDMTPPEITVTADTHVFIKCVGTFGDPDTYVITIETSTSPETPTGTEITATTFTSFFYIGWIGFTSGSPDIFAINNLHSGGNVGVESFGAVNLWWRR